MTAKYVPRDKWYRTREGLVFAITAPMTLVGAVVWIAHLVTVVLADNGLEYIWFNGALLAATLTLAWTAHDHYTPYKWK